MDLKQKLSFLAAAALPAAALSVYLFLVPARAVAFSCPGGTFHAPCGTSGCQSGTGTCYNLGSQGIYVFCPPHPGAGICQAGGTVCCTQ